MTMLRYLLLVSTLAMCHGAFVPNCNPALCKLPDCYCSYKDIPGDGDMSPEDTPQMVLFTYTGALNSKARKAIKDVFPDSRKNRNTCSIGITLFVVSQGSDDCGVHRMYYRGHEIALSGMNRTGWTAVDWTKQIMEQHAHITENSFIEGGQITGMRAQKLKPGGDNMLQVALADGLFYDSSYLAGPKDSLSDSLPYLWPFTMDKVPFYAGGDDSGNTYGLICKNPECPKAAYAGFWEIPISSLIGSRGGSVRPCTFLDDCITDLKTKEQVFSLLKKNFLFSYNGNRAPYQVNLSPTSLEIKIITDGLKLFLDFLENHQDVWMLTNQEALRWIQTPVPLSNIIDSGIWDCPEKGEYVECEFQDVKDKPMIRVTFREIMDVESLWIVQTVFLIILYFFVYKYDRYARKDA